MPMSVHDPRQPQVPHADLIRLYALPRPGDPQAGG